MDEFLRTRFRVVGIVTIIIICVFFIVLLFVQNKEKKDTSIKLKVFYSQMSQAFSLSKSTFGALSEWGWSPGSNNATLLRTKIFNNFILDKDCIDGGNSCIPNSPYKSLKLKNTTVNLYKIPSVKLKNGISVAIKTISSCANNDDICALMFVDLNNIEEPNAFGKDLFVFSIINSDKMPIIPYNFSADRKILIDDLTFGCNEDSKIALNCAAYIAQKAWVIDSSYPW